jgi:hypothetical protein
MPARPNQIALTLTDWQRERLAELPAGDRSEYIRQAITEKLIRDELKKETEMNTEWANEQIEAIAPTQEAVRAFDASEDGKRYRAITGMTMWENLGGDTLPPTAEEETE